MTENIKYHSYYNYKDIEIWHGDRDKGKFIINTVSEHEANTVVNELNTLLSENIRLEKENKDLEVARSYYQENFLTMKTERNQFSEENKELKQLIKKVMDERFVGYPLLCKLKEMVEE